MYSTNQRMQNIKKNLLSLKKICTNWSVSWNLKLCCKCQPHGVKENENTTKHSDSGTSSWQGWRNSWNRKRTNLLLLSSTLHHSVLQHIKSSKPNQIVPGSRLI